MADEWYEVQRGHHLSGGQISYDVRWEGVTDTQLADTTQLESRESYSYLVTGWGITPGGSGGHASSARASNQVTMPPPIYIPWGVSAVSSKAGRLDVFVIYADTAMYWQYWQGGKWSGWQVLDGRFLSGPAVDAYPDGDLTVFGVGLDFALYYRNLYRGNWSPGWQRLAGPVASDPVVATGDPGGVRQAVVIGGQEPLGNLSGPLTQYQHTRTALFPQPPPQWQGPTALGGTFISDTTALFWAPGRLAVFGIGTDRAAWHSFNDGNGWRGPASIGGQFSVGASLRALASVSVAPNELDLFGVAPSPPWAVYHKLYSGDGWQPAGRGWESLGGSSFSAPAAVSWGSDRIDVFVIGTDQGLYHKYCNFVRGKVLGVTERQWSGWEGRGGGPFHGDPVALSQSPNTLDVFAVGEDFAVHHLAYDQHAGWHPWESLGGTVGGRIGPE